MLKAVKVVVQFMRFVFLACATFSFFWCDTVESAGLIVTVSGVEDNLKDNVEQLLSIRALVVDPTLLKKATGQTVSEIDARDEARLPRLHRAADQEIAAALQPFGYYQPIIEKSLELDGSNWRAIYSISVGNPVVLDEIRLTAIGDGALEESVQTALRASLLVRGERLLHEKYQQQKSALLDAAIQASYLDATFTKSQLRVNPETQKASVELAIDTKARYYFGDVQFEQNVLSPDLVKSYVPFSPGDPFNSNRLVELQLALGDSQYFERVEITAQRDQAVDNRIPVNIKAIPSKAREYTVAFGFGTDTGPRVKLGTEFRRVNKSGHRVHADLLLSAVKSSASASYEIPLGVSGVDSLRFLARFEDAEIGDGDGDTQRFVLGASYNDTWRTWQRRLYMNYTREIFEFGGNSDTVQFLTPGITISYTKADNVLLPRVGYSWSVDLHGANESVISSSSFLRGRVVGQRVWSPSDQSRILLKSEIGATKTEAPEDLPTASRFFAGGDRSVRGYRFQSIGPVDAEGNTVGGRYLARASLEMDYLFLNDIGGAVFVDAGDASNDTKFNLKKSVGIGLRWRSPVGMFRLDLASPLDDSENSYRLHISIGADL